LEITLPSGASATLRDTFLRGDRRAARRALKLTIDSDGTRHMDLSVEDNVTGALLRQMIVSWTIPQPVPRDAQTDELAQGILDAIDDDDYAALAKEVRPYYLKVMRSGGVEDEDPNSPSGATGTSGSAAQDGQGTLTI
jgi:hypothetical protein